MNVLYSDGVMGDIFEAAGKFVAQKIRQFISRRTLFNFKLCILKTKPKGKSFCRTNKVIYGCCGTRCKINLENSCSGTGG